MVAHGGDQPLHHTLTPALRSVALGREICQAKPETQHDTGERGPNKGSHRGCGTRVASIM